jgi:hypothetical protein
MAQISATFKSDYSESRHWVIQDIGIDQNSPATLFDGYLGPNDVTQPLPLYSSDGIYGLAIYQRSDGAPTRVDNITDGQQVSMS